MANISQAERDKLPGSDFAGPHESFPIRNQQDVMDAARLIGHAADPAAVRARIIAIARRKGFSIPDAWKESGAEKSFMGTPFAMMVPITKVDLVHRLVYGVAALEQLDKSGEIFDYESSKPHFQAWTNDFSKRTAGKSKGNVREMHRDVAAGKLTELNFNDAQRQVEVAAKVVDDAAWEKVQEGVYTGFSIGGSYANKWSDPAGKGLRYTAKPSEISLVDNPCMPGATFTAVKSDGSTEVRKFATTQEEITVDPETETEDIEKATPGTDEIAYDDGSPIPDDFGKAAASDNDAEDTKGDAKDDSDDEVAEKDDDGDMAMSARIDDLAKSLAAGEIRMDKMITLLDQLLQKTVGTVGTVAQQAETPAEKMDKIEAPTEDGLVKALLTKFETQTEELRKATEVITQLEARLVKIENDPVPGGPFLSGDAMEKAAKLGLLSVQDKTLATDSGTNTFDPANKSQAIAVLKKLQQETTDPFRKQELGATIFEMEFREGLREQ